VLTHSSGVNSYVRRRQKAAGSIWWRQHQLTSG
jgi:hypothetical protein